jgi:DNA-binding GntR family transcriptional regulator
MVTQFESRTLAEQAFHVIEHAILSGELKPGVELAEVDLSEKYGVSRGPIREALRQLSAVGLVQLMPRRPAVVRVFSKKEFLDGYLLREALEALAVRLAVPQLSLDDIKVLIKRSDEMEKATLSDDVTTYFIANNAFHRVFVEKCGNTQLRELYDQVTKPMLRYQRWTLQLRGELHSSLAEHNRIVDAVRSGNAEEAAKLMIEHIHVPLSRLDEWIDE